MCDDSNNKQQQDDSGVGLADIGSNNNKSYNEDNINESSHNDDNNDNLPTSWRSLLEVSNNKSRKIKGSNYVQLATVDPLSNGPRCRCVVFRGFLDFENKDHECAAYIEDKSCVMRMVTDLRSQKVHQVNAHDNNDESNAELIWWFGKSNEQYRIRGRLVFVGDENKKHFPYDNDNELIAARKEAWGNMSDSGREAFFMEPTPGEQYVESTKDSDVPEGGRDKDGKVLPPPGNFLLMLLIPNYVDYLRLGKDQYRQIDEFEVVGEKEWTMQRVNP